MKPFPVEKDGVQQRIFVHRVARLKTECSWTTHEVSSATTLSIILSESSSCSTT